MKKRIGWFIVVPLLLARAPVHAVDGVIEINMARASAGGVTPSDDPGFPVTISQSGSYRLSGNLTVDNADTTAIEIFAGSVTVDLNGFTVSGPTVCSGSPLTCAPVSSASGRGYGIVSFASNGYLVVTNGTVRGMGYSGVHANGSARVEGVRVESNGGFAGISAATGQLVASKDIAVENNGHGIFANKEAIVSECVTLRNNFVGIDVGPGSVVVHSVANLNANGGITARDKSNGSVSKSVAIGNVARGNGHLGIAVGTDGGSAFNVMTDNNGPEGNNNAQSSGFVLGPNVCGTDIACP